MYPGFLNLLPKWALAYTNKGRQLRLAHLPKGLQQVPHHGSLRVPEHQAPTRSLAPQAEQVQFLAQLSVIPPCSFHLEAVICLQLVLCFPGSPVDALQLSLCLIPPPVGACRAGALLLKADQAAVYGCWRHQSCPAAVCWSSSPCPKTLKGRVVGASFGLK